jgi:hypothetical protein
MNILPRGKATITRGAIKFKGLYYIATEMIENRMFANSLHSVEVVYDPRDIRNIYVLREGNKKYITFNLDNRSIVYSSYTLEDVMAAKRQQNALHKVAADISLERQMQLDDELYKLAKKSELLTGKPTQTKAERIRNIRINHAQEKTAQREKEAFVPEKEKKSAKIIPLHENSKIADQLDNPYEDQMNMIAKILEEDDNHGKDDK